MIMHYFIYLIHAKHSNFLVYHGNAMHLCNFCNKQGGMESLTMMLGWHHSNSVESTDSLPLAKDLLCNSYG